MWNKRSASKKIYPLVNSTPRNRVSRKPMMQLDLDLESPNPGSPDTPPPLRSVGSVILKHDILSSKVKKYVARSVSILRTSSKALDRRRIQSKGHIDRRLSRSDSAITMTASVDFPRLAVCYGSRCSPIHFHRFSFGRIYTFTLSSSPTRRSSFQGFPLMLANVCTCICSETRPLYLEAADLRMASYKMSITSCADEGRGCMCCITPVGHVSPSPFSIHSITFTDMTGIHGTINSHGIVMSVS